jgi:hypothetical protein
MMSELEKLEKVKKLAGKLNFTVVSCFYAYDKVKTSDASYEWFRKTCLAVLDLNGTSHELSATTNKQIKDELRALALSV